MFRIKAVRFAPGLVFPRSAVLQPDIYFAGIVGTCIVNDTLPFGRGRGQPDVGLAVTVEIIPAAIVPAGILHGDDVAQEGYIMGACSVFSGIHIDGAAVIGKGIVTV